ncbi:hypothetical protein JW872_01210 [Candidatus Babeliales bacterium]|nr:hypothetical protein [Candidatus Babeliales bacterium]
MKKKVLAASLTVVLGTSFFVYHYTIPETPIAPRNEIVIVQGIGAILVEAAGKIAAFVGELAIRRTVLKAAYAAAREAAKEVAEKVAAKQLARSAAIAEMRTSVEAALEHMGTSWVEKALQRTIIRDVATQAMPTLMSKILHNPISIIIAYLPVGMALGMLTQWEDQKDADEFAVIDEKRKTLEENFDTFIDDAQVEQETIFAQLAGNFAAAQEQLEAQYEASGSTVERQLMTLDKSLNIALPKQMMLIDQINLDKAFAHSPMFTPSGRYSWYNVSRCGDWQFNESTNSFIQTQLQTFFDQSDPKSPEYAQNNSIFSEYVTASNGYEIEIACTPHRVSYPFCLGIMFNKARWLSGSPERMRQYRLLGLYGTNINNVPAASVHFAQTIIRNTADGLSITTPIKQLVEPESQAFQVLTEEQLQKLNEGTLRLIFKIRTAANQVSFKVWEQGATEQETQANEPLEYTTINNLEQFGFLYGGIGFMAPGCVAEFTVKKPEELRYTQNQLDTFKTLVTTKLQQRSSS